MVRGRSAKPLCSGSIPLDSFKACRKASLFFSERLGKAGSVLNIEAVRKGGLVFKKANCERTRFLYTHLHYQTLFSYNYLEANLL